jgi:hypothetical protein
MGGVGLLQRRRGNLLERRRIVGWIFRDLLQGGFEHLYPYVGVVQHLHQLA